MSRVVQALSFFPRGGSAQVVRYLSRALHGTGWDPRIAAGSVGDPGDPRNAKSFFAGETVEPVDFTDALRAAERGEDPMDQPVPLHPSYEDRPEAPDRVFAKVSPALAERQVTAWKRALHTAGASVADVLHLHHLTPVHDAAARGWAGTPVVTHLHGTELLMLEQIDRLLASTTGAPADSLRNWPHAAHWAERLRKAAHRSRRVLAISPDHAARATRTLQLSDDRLTVVPNGVDTERFQRIDLDPDTRRTLLRRWLVEDPRGWDETGVPGSLRYTERDLAAFFDAATWTPHPLLLFVGRFTAVKRLPSLIEAYARLRARLGPVAPLLVWGGHPGEWEGEHPHTVARRKNVDGVFFVGWRDHDDLRLGLGCADVLVVPSVGEAFGAVYLEAMASGVPVIATRTGGPPSFVNLDPTRPDGWLVPPDDEDALLDAMVDAVSNPAVRRRRGEAAREHVHRRHSWTSVAERVAAVYEEVRR